MSEQVWADRRVMTCGYHQDEAFDDECLFCRIKELETELVSRECYGEWCGKGHDCLCPACEWKAKEKAPKKDEL